jgi:hypothetical protein
MCITTVSFKRLSRLGMIYGVRGEHKEGVDRIRSICTVYGYHVCGMREYSSLLEFVSSGEQDSSVFVIDDDFLVFERVLAAYEFEDD